MNDLIQRNNPQGRLMRSYPAIVVNVEHPEGLYLVQVRIMGLWDDIPEQDLPYAEFLLPLGAKPNHGHAVPVEVNDLVWIDFPRNGDTRYPRITGSIYYAPENISNLPNEIFNTEPYQQKRHADEPQAPEFTKRDDIYKRFGLIEHKTVEGGWCITSMKSGSAVEISKDGQIIIHCESDAYRSSKNGTVENVGSDHVIKIIGSSTQNIGKELKITVAGNASIDATKIMLNGGAGVVTGEHICQFTGSPHSDCSKQVFAGK